MKKFFAVLITLSMLTAALSGCARLQKDPAADTVSEFVEKADSALKSNEATVANNVGEADNSSSSDSDFDANKVVDNIEVEGYAYST